MTWLFVRGRGAALIAALCLAACAGGSDAPASTGEPATPGSSTTIESVPTSSAGSIIAIAADEDLTALVGALVAAELDATLATDGPFTLFAPSDAAFAALAPGTLDRWLSDPKGELTEILTYHVVDGRLAAADVVAAEALTTVHGAEVVVDADARTIGGAAITRADIDASNGVVHMIDAVLMPR